MLSENQMAQEITKRELAMENKKKRRYVQQQSPSMELTLLRWGGISTKKFQPECVNEESSTERRS